MTLPPVANPIKLLMLQLRAESGLTVLDTTWVQRWTLGDDGVARCVPLFVNDVPAYVHAIWWDVLA